MNAAFIKTTFLILLTQTVFAGIGDLEKSLPSYYISSSKADSSLAKNESVYTFRFSESSMGNLVKGDIKMSCNGKNLVVKRDENARLPDGQGKGTNGIFTLKVKPGKHIFKFFYTKDFFEITTDSIAIKPSFRTTIEVTFQSSKYPVICDKPVIYIYPKETTQVNIKLDLKGKLNFTYPVYNSGWNFIAEPDGTISIGEGQTEKKYNYLFWEGTTDIDANKINSNEGFIVEKSNLIQFFEEKLSKMGLNTKEQADFITYWCPLMSANEKNYVHFLFNEEFNNYAPLTISPKPDTIFRVFMIWSKANEKNDLKLVGQKIPSLERKGLTVVEWGGTQVHLNFP